MTEPQPPNDQAPQLQYRSGIDERFSRPRVPILVQAIVGALLTSFALAISVVLAFLADGGTAIAIMVLVAAITFFAAVAHVLKADSKTRGWTIGIWIGIALTGLLEGLCFLRSGI